MEEQDSGDITEYHVFSSIITLSPTPIPNAPPEAPSPIIKTMIGTSNFVISNIFLAIASPCPLSVSKLQDHCPYRAFSLRATKVLHEWLNLLRDSDLHCLPSRVTILEGQG